MPYTYEKYYDASDGCSLVTTIDATVQAYVEKNLQNAIDKYDIKNGAFCIVMDVNTGEIKAMATLGSYDPNNYLEIYDDAAAALLENERDPLYPYNFQKILCALLKAQPTPFHIPDSPFSMLYLHFPIHLYEQNTLVLLLRF